MVHNMSHIAAAHWVDWLGLLAGVIGVSIAIWLQLITQRRCKPRYVFGFFILGSTLILMNLGPVFPEKNGVVLGKFVAYIVLIGAQFKVAHEVYEHSNIKTSISIQKKIQFSGDKKK